ncbi:MAG TPA: aminotransferase class III-fold pyridoxal phosphate-dependent enzyme, partial [Burkholderiaceae bacterium]
LDHIPYNDIEAARAAITDDVCAVLVEPIQGEGGVVPGDAAYLQELRDLCTKTGALLIFDEVQSGVGRTGDLFAYMGYGIVPDILTAAKALGNGYPIGAMITTNEIASVFGVGTHGTTYGGNPLAATVALNVLDIMTAPGFMDRVKQASNNVRAMLEAITRDYPQMFTLVRGSGLLLGMVVADEFKGRAKDITKSIEAQGLLLLIAGPDVVRLAPALIVSDEQIAQAEQLMRAGLDAFLSTPAGK